MDEIKYEISQADDGTFKVSFIIENPEQRVWFHDNVAIQIAGNGDFIGTVYDIFRRDFASCGGSFVRKINDLNRLVSAAKNAAKALQVAAGGSRADGWYESVRDELLDALTESKKETA